MTSQDTPGLTIAAALTAATARLRASGASDARRDAATLLMHRLACDRAFLIAHATDVLAPDAHAQFRGDVARRAAGEPVQYITGRQEFYGLEFAVTPAVLIPRPETELLVETALARTRLTPRPHFCDVGTGSGCIAIALLHERADAQATGLDISPAALAVATRNAARHGVAARLQLLESDCFAALSALDTRFDLIAANPPYIAAAAVPGLQREVRDHEPHTALTPGGDGLAIIRRLLTDAPRWLRPGGHFVCEIGYEQQAAVTQLIAPHVWTLLDIHRDLQGIPRVVSLRLRG